VYLRLQRLAIARRFRTLRFKTDKATSHQLNPTPHLGSPEPALSLSQRLKKLSREYGWSAVGVYFALSVLDFPFCFLAVRLLGTDRIGRYEAVLKNGFWSVVRIAFPNAGPTEKEVSEDIAEATAREGHVGGTEIDIGPGADACKESWHWKELDTDSHATAIWTQLGLAYLVHKSFIFVRVPLTAAVLPKVVKTLRSWGYDIGKKKAKKVKNIKPA
jgi:hypothetical protein